MTEDANGLIYLGTHDGVDVFDGRRFMHIRVPGLTEKGINPFVNQMRWGRRGLLWVCTRTHIYTYDPSTGHVRVLYGNSSAPSVGNIEVDTTRNRVYFIDKDTLKSCIAGDTALITEMCMPVAAVFESRMSRAGDVYLMVERRKIVKLVGDKLMEVFNDPAIIDMDYSVHDDAIVVLCSKGLVAISCKTGRATQLPAKNAWPFETAKTRLTTLADGRVLVHHLRGIDLFRNIRDSLPIRYSADERNPYSLKADFVICAMADGCGNLWISEDGINLSVLPRSSQGVKYVSERMTGATRLWVSYHDPVRKQVFTSTELGISMYRYSGDTPLVTAQIKPPGFKFFEPMAFEPWNENELLVLTNGQGPWLFHTANRRFRPFDTLARRAGNRSCYGIRRLSPGRYVIFGSAGMYIFDRGSGAFVMPVVDTVSSQTLINGRGIHALLVDHRKRIWAADGAELHVFDSNLHHVKAYGGKSASNRSGLANTVIMDIRQARDSDIYITTMGGGMARLTPADTFAHVPLTADISSVFCIGVLDSQHLLVTSAKGLILYNTRSRVSRVLNESYGLPVADFNQFAFEMDDRLVTASGTRGYIIIDRQDVLPMFHDTARLLVMDGMKVLDSITLGRGRHTLELDIAVPGYRADADWLIRYKLEGVDDEWRTLGKGEWKVRYNSVSPGSYTLKVEAGDGQHILAAAPVLIPIVALPYFWQTTWFRVLLLAVILASLVVVVRFFSQLQLRWRLKKLEDEQKIARERIRISRELHDNVGSQLTYLISGLESSNILLKKQDTGRLEEKLGKMQLSARESMQQLRDSIWALNNEAVPVSVLFSRFRTWLEHIMEAAPDMHYSISSNIDDDISLDPIRGLNVFRIMQEAVHNVLKHAKAGNLAITYACREGMLSISIEDNGVGFDSMENGGHGRRTMSARAEEAGGRLDIISIKNSGTAVKLRLELNGTGRR